MRKVFVVFKESASRRRVLQSGDRQDEDYLLYGAKDLERRGWKVSHNLEAPPAGRATYFLNKAITTIWNMMGGYGGNWAVARSVARRVSGNHDAVLFVADSVGIPFLLMRPPAPATPPIVYISMGLPERLATLRGDAMVRRYRRAYGAVSAVLCFGHEESRLLQSWFGFDERKVRFVPFGVDTAVVRPRPDATITDDAVCLGADRCRDFNLFVRLAQSAPGRRFKIVTTAGWSKKLPPLPSNIRLVTDVPFNVYLDEMASSRVVVLPVKENSYSGATTTLLQAMALAKPVVVSRTGAIVQGYELRDNANCRLVPSGDFHLLKSATDDLLHDESRRRSIGVAARETSVRHLDWSLYVNRLEKTLESACEGAIRPAGS